MGGKNDFSKARAAVEVIVDSDTTAAIDCGQMLKVKNTIRATGWGKDICGDCAVCMYCTLWRVNVEYFDMIALVS